MMKRVSILAALFLMIVIRSEAVHAEQLVAKEEALKAAFTVKFLNFVIFPEKQEETRLCVYASSEIQEVFKNFENTSQRLRRIKVVFPEKVEEAHTCHVVYFSSSVKAELRSLLRTVEGRPTLTVSDMSEFCNKGGMIELDKSQAKLKFDVNLSKARKSGLSIRSGLLSLARKVIQD